MLTESESESESPHENRTCNILSGCKGGGVCMAVFCEHAETRHIPYSSVPSFQIAIRLSYSIFDGKEKAKLHSETHSLFRKGQAPFS